MIIYSKPTKNTFHEVKIESRHSYSYFRGFFLGETVIAGKGFIGFQDIIDGTEFSVPIENVLSIRQVSITIEEDKLRNERKEPTITSY